jgi:hypothetical protein
MVDIDEFYNYIKEYQKGNGNKCGLPLTKLVLEFDISLSEAQELLRNLHKNKKIKIRKGINDYLVFNI